MLGCRPATGSRQQVSEVGEAACGEGRRAADAAAAVVARFVGRSELTPPLPLAAAAAGLF